MPHGGLQAPVKAREASRKGMQQQCASRVDSTGERRARHQWTQEGMSSTASRSWKLHAGQSRERRMGTGIWQELASAGHQLART